MRDVNGSSFLLLAGAGDWPCANGMSREGHLLAKQVWRLPAVDAATARTVLAATRPLVVDEIGAVARIRDDGLAIESLDGTSWVAITDLEGNALQPKVGRFIDMALGGARLALLASDGTSTYLELFDLRGRWPLDSIENPAVPLVPDPAGALLAVAADGPILVLVPGGVAIFEGGPIEQFVERQATRFEPVAPNPDALRQTGLVGRRPGATPRAMTIDPQQLLILNDEDGGAQTLVVMDRETGAWSLFPINAVDGATLPPYITDVGLLGNGLVALLAPIVPGSSPSDGAAARDCAVVSLVPASDAAPAGVALAGSRYPMLSQSAPRFARIPGPDVRYLSSSGPRPLLPLPHPGFVTRGALACFSLVGKDPDLVWHRLYLEAHLPPGTSLSVWARAADTPIAGGDREAAVRLVLAVGPEAVRVAPGDDGVPAAGTLTDALAEAPFHRQPPLARAALASELPFHPGLAALDGQPGELFELLLQRSGGANRRLTGALLDLVVVASGDGRLSPCLRAVRVYTPRFCYQDQYLPTLFHQTAVSDETDQGADVSGPDFRERLLAAFEGTLTPIEGRAAAAEYLLDPYAAPANALPWLASYLGRPIDPAWPQARQRRALAEAGRLLRMRGTYRGVCLALDIATDGAVGRGEVVLVETHRLRRTAATVLGVPMSGRNVLTEDGIASGNSIVGDTLVLSSQRAIDVLALLAPSAAQGAEPAQVAQFLDEYAERVQVAAVVHRNDPALLAAVNAVLGAELPAQLNFEVIVNERSFILGLAPLLGIDTFLEPWDPPAPLRLDRSVIGRDTVIRDPATLRQ